jgi:UDPglucose 6-dehydrogenase
MTKHAINAFLATSISYANEIALLCEKTGIDAQEVELGLKSEERIGYKAYLSPGAAFAGGTLARDLSFLTGIGRAKGEASILLEAVRTSNEHHKNWPKRKILEVFAELKGTKFAILGLTYKPGTDTLRRSEAVELCKWLINQGVKVNACDPAVTELPEELAKEMTLCPDVRLALNDADCVVVTTEWPVFWNIPADLLHGCMKRPVVVDMKGFLREKLGNDQRFIYFAVGRGTR